MLTCPILSPYLSEHGHGRSAIMIMSSSSVTTSIAEFDFLVSFLQGLWLAKMPIYSILVDHAQIISVTVKRPVTSHIVSSKYSY